MAATISIALAGCAGSGSGEDTGTSCTALSGSAWTPNVTGSSDSNHDSSVTVTSSVITGSGLLTGVAQKASATQEITVTIPMQEDLGTGGSLSLVAETTDFPSNLEGSAYPLLVSLSDGTNDLINLTRSASSTTDCAGAGFFDCDSSPCSINSACTVQSPSAYASRTDWQQHQVVTFGTTSVNTFPTCNWSDTTTTCAFNTTFFSGGKLRSGVDYTAKYVLMSQYYPSMSGYRAGLKVTAVKKSDPTPAAGAMDLNVILVGSTNVTASRTSKGQRNLNALFEAVQTYYSQTGVGIKLGKVTAIEWGCAEGGDTYATLDYEKAMPLMLAAGKSVLPSGTEGKALNLYIVSKITASGTTSGLTILGISGGIGGPPLNGTQSSGLVFSSFDDLDTYNANCPADSCPASLQDDDFQELAITVAHEMGHYLGLNHPSESDGTLHDSLPDTPICTKTQSVKGTDYITISSCAQDSNTFAATGKTCSDVCVGYDGKTTFCATATECQFNHIMWWTSKNYNATTGLGDGNLFSSQSSGILNYSTFIR